MASNINSELLKLIDSEEFVKNLQLYATKFKARKGFGRWLVEYQRMEQKGLFKPDSLKAQYIKVLRDVSTLQYLYWEAIHYIGSQALEATQEYFDNCYCDIRVITGEIAEDDNGELLQYLGLDEAKELCQKMNEEIEEELFVVYDSQTNKQIKI